MHEAGHPGPCPSPGAEPSENGSANPSVAEEASIAPSGYARHDGPVAAMGQLAAAVAQSLNPPLTSLLIGSEATARWLERPDPDVSEALESLGMIRVAGHRAARITRVLQALLRQPPPRFSVVLLSDVLDDVLSASATTLRNRRVKVVDLRQPGEQAVLADPALLHQAVVHLVANALEAMVSTPVEDRRLVIETREEAGAVVLSIIDNGPGLSPDVQLRMFDPFFTTKPEALGMGLAVTRAIVEAHGGRLIATSRAGHGACLSFGLDRTA